MTTLSEHLARLGKKGGEARARKMTPEQRSDSARKAIEARWAKAEKKLTRAEAQLGELVKKNEKRLKPKRRKA